MAELLALEGVSAGYGESWGLGDVSLAGGAVREFADVLAVLSGSGDLALVLVEQHAEAALEITRRAVVMERGRIVHASASDELLADRGTLDRWLAASGA